MPLRRALLGAVAALSLCAAGCTTTATSGPTTPTASSPSVTAPATPAGPVTLRVAVYGDQQTVAAYQRLADAFVEDHPGVGVTLEQAPDARTAAQRRDRQFAAGRAPDVFLVDHDQLPELVAQDRVHPLDQLLEERGVLFGDNFSRLGLEAFSADSALQCMPADVSPLVVFYNKRLVHPHRTVVPGQDLPSRENGWTWEQFAQAARGASHGDVKGFYIAPRLQSLLPLVRSAGADLLDDDRSPSTLAVGDDATRAALERILEVVRDPQLSPSAQDLAQQDALSRFEDGRIAMMFGTRSLVPKLREATGLHFDVYPLPNLGKPRTITDMSGYCVSAHTAHVAQAADFVAYATGPAGAKITAGVGGIVPANLPALHSREFLQPGSRPGHAEVFADALRRADAPPFVAGWPVLEAQLQPLLDQLFYAPVVDLDRLLPRMTRRSERVLAPAPSPSASP